MDTTRSKGPVLGAGLLLAALLALTALPALAQDGSPLPDGAAASVVPPTEEPLGVPYGEWGQRWWQWLVSTPSDVNPLLTGDCQPGQGGDVFFIPHTFAGETVETTCTVDPGQWILASAGSASWDNSDGCCDEEGSLEAGVLAERPTYSDLAVTIDGHAVEDIDSYWVVSPVFSIEYPEDNVLGAEPGTYDAVTGGWFVMIPPLEPGTHTIVVHDAIDFSDGDGPQVAELTATVEVAAAD